MAIDVPDMESNAAGLSRAGDMVPQWMAESPGPSEWAETMTSPGNMISGLSRPSVVGPRDENGATLTRSHRDGLLTMFSRILDWQQ